MNAFSTYLESIRPQGAPRLVLGCELLGGADWGDVDLVQAEKTIRCALENGIRLFDTADVYGLGLSETRLGACLRELSPEACVITKGGVRWTADETSGRARTTKDLSRDYLEHALAQSLHRLGVSQVPLYLAHWPDGQTDIALVVETLEGLIEAGGARFAGLSNFSLADLQRPGVLESIAAVELEHSLINQHSDVIALLQQADVVPLTYGSLAQGLLSGKYGPQHSFAPNDRRHRLAHFQGDRGAYEPLLRAMADHASELGLTTAQLALAWAVTTNPTGFVVVGARTPAQLEAMVEASHVTLTSEVTDALAGLAPAKRSSTP